MSYLLFLKSSVQSICMFIFIPFHFIFFITNNCIVIEVLLILFPDEVFNFRENIIIVLIAYLLYWSSALSHHVYYLHSLLHSSLPDLFQTWKLSIVYYYLNIKIEKCYLNMFFKSHNHQFMLLSFEKTHKFLMSVAIISYVD